MVVEGEIVSVSRKAVDVPRLRFGVRNGLGAEIYNWTAMPSRTVAQAGRAADIPLAARLAARRNARHQREILQPPRRDGWPTVTKTEKEQDMARILIAEDEDSLRSLIARALMQDGHEVLAKADGGEALDCLTHEKGRFDLLLTDIRMPVMDGIALALAASRDYPGADDTADDRLCRPARTRARLERADPRRHHQAVLARGYPRRVVSASMPQLKHRARPDLSQLTFFLEILEQPLEIIELDLRAQRIGEAAAQLLENAARALHVDLARHFDIGVVVIGSAVARAGGRADRSPAARAIGRCGRAGRDRDPCPAAAAWTAPCPARPCASPRARGPARRPHCRNCLRRAGLRPRPWPRRRGQADPFRRLVGLAGPARRAAGPCRACAIPASAC